MIFRIVGIREHATVRGRWNGLVAREQRWTPWGARKVRQQMQKEGFRCS